MIEARVGELVGEVMSTGDSCVLKERLDRIGELDHAVAMLQAALSVEMAAFAADRRLEDLATGCSDDVAGRGAPFEIAMARRVSKAAVDYHLAYAEPLATDFPQLLHACLDGQVSQAAVKHIVRETEILDSERRRTIDPELTELAKQLTPGKAKKAAARLVASTDPDAAAMKAGIARARKQVRAILNGDATGTVVADLPAEQAVACWQALDHQARCLRADGDPRAIRELLCDLFVERLTGQAKATDLNLEVGVVVAASSMLGFDDQPGKLHGRRGGDYGTLPAALVRKLATSQDAWMRRLICDPVDGRLVSMDATKRRFTGALRKFIVYRDGTSRRPHSDAPIHDIDHVEPHASGGPTSAVNGQGVGKTDHAVRDLPGWRVEAIDGDAGTGVRWTTPTGHTYESRPPPILGYGSRRRAVARRRHRTWAKLELHTLRLLVEFDARHRPRRN